jgi:hypothetical protein
MRLSLYRDNPVAGGRMRVKIKETSGLEIVGKGKIKKAGDTLTISKAEYISLGGEKHFINLDVLKKTSNKNTGNNDNDEDETGNGNEEEEDEDEDEEEDEG